MILNLTLRKRGHSSKKGVVYYMDDGRVRGVLLWNVWEKVEEARALMREAGLFDEKDLKGRIKG